jgi:hypothetical protein
MKIFFGTLVFIVLSLVGLIYTFPIAALVTFFGNVEMLSGAVGILLGVVGVVGAIIFAIASFGVMASTNVGEVLSTKEFIKKFAPIWLSVVLILGTIKIILPKNGEMLLYAVGAQILYQNEDAQKIAKSATGILSSAIKIVETKAKQWENNMTALPVPTIPDKKD